MNYHRRIQRIEDRLPIPPDDAKQQRDYILSCATDDELRAIRDASDGGDEAEAQRLWRELIIRYHLDHQHSER